MRPPQYSIFYILFILCFLTAKNRGSGTPINYDKIMAGDINTVQTFKKMMGGISFASQNCNSLNMTNSTAQNQRLKIEAISSLSADIIFLSDIRLGNKNLTTSKGEISKLFLVNNHKSYDFITNSTRNKRGVGVLFSRGLNYRVLNSEADPDENFLLLSIELNGKPLTIGSIYGPNDHNPQFFQNLYRALLRLGNAPIILGGDFNCTPSSDNIDNNMDCLHMQELPNYRHSVYLAEFCEALNLMDPFRTLHPAVKKFSYKPFGNLRKNRSRIDFFLISDNLLPLELTCTIGDHLLGKFFDHKPVYLRFNGPAVRNKCTKKLQISNFILADKDVDIVAWFSIFETYLLHLEVEPELLPDLNQTL
jgi:exonuclease III